MKKKDKKIILFNCNIVTEFEVLVKKAIVISNNIIDEIIDESKVFTYNAKLINCNGDYILPGLIDIHSDVIEKIIVPRKSVMFDNLIALNEIDRELMLHGITTIFHSISIAESTVCDNKRTLKLDNMFELCDLIGCQRNNLSINHKFHARLELNSINAFNYIYPRLDQGIINELSFMDHTPGQGQYKNIDVFKSVIQQQYGFVSEKRKNEIIDICVNKPKLDLQEINALIFKANEFEIPMAYHDVDSKEQIDWMKKNNIKICEFPLNEDIAQYASEQGMYTIVGAPNIILGHSHYNNANASQLLLNGSANIICSDYFSSSLLLSIFKMNKLFNVPLHLSTNYATLYPAKAVNIGHQYGSIETGKIADLIVVNTSDLIPKVSKVFISGELRLETIARKDNKIC